VEDLAKIIASVLPARGVSRYPPLGLHPLGEIEELFDLLRLKSVICRKSRFAMSPRDGQNDR